MTRWEGMVFLVAAVAVVMSGLAAAAEEKSEEELPKTSALRRPRPPSSSSFGVKQSYDLSEAYNVMAANRMGVGSGFSNGASSRGGSSKVNRDGYDSLHGGDSSAQYYESYSPPSDYGGYPSESGYGYLLNKYVDCSSAIGLLSFLLFIDVLRDAVEELTQTNGRKRRHATPEDFEGHEREHELLQFLADGGADGVLSDIPSLLIPLLTDLTVAAKTEEAPTSCLAQPLCQANAELSRRYGAFGRIMAVLISNVATRALLPDDPTRRQHALHASRRGRDDSSSWATCRLAFPCGRANGTFSGV